MCLYQYVVYVHELSLEARPAGRSSPKFKSPDIFTLTDSSNIIMLAKFSRYMASEGLVTTRKIAVETVIPVSMYVVDC